MALSLETKRINPPRILIYGTEGVGKTSFGSLAPNPVFIQTERGLSGIQNVASFPLAKSFQDVLKYFGELATEDHDFQTVVIDSIDWLEPLIWDQVCEEWSRKLWYRYNGHKENFDKEKKVDNIEDVGGGFGKGYMAALDLWQQYFDALDYLNEHKQMIIIQIAHAQIKRYENPETSAYDRYSIKLQDGKSCSAAAKMIEYNDMILFANYRVHVKVDDKSFNKERKRAIGGDERVIYTEERASFRAKNRYSLPPEIEFTKDGSYWATIAEYVPYFGKMMGN